MFDFFGGEVEDSMGNGSFHIPLMPGNGRAGTQREGSVKVGRCMGWPGLVGDVEIPVVAVLWE